MGKFALAVALFGAVASSWAAAPEWVAAGVVKVDVQRSRVLLDHDAIRSIGMEPMTMPFMVAKGGSLRNLKPEDKIRFTFVNKDDHLTINRIEVVR